MIGKARYAAEVKAVYEEHGENLLTILGEEILTMPVSVLVDAVHEAALKDPRTRRLAERVGHLP